jgi:hypothetical protein
MVSIEMIPPHIGHIVSANFKFMSIIWKCSCRLLLMSDKVRSIAPI